MTFVILSSKSVLNMETMNVISFCYDKDYYDFIIVTEENYYYEKKSHIELLQSYLNIDNIDLSLIRETQNYINKNVNEKIN